MGRLADDSDATEGLRDPPSGAATARPDELRRHRFLIAVAALALTAAVWAVVGSSWVLPHLSANSDEGVYLLQAETLASGRLLPEAPDEDPQAHVPWFAVVRDGSYVLKYTPVHAAVLAAADRAVGTTRAGIALIAAAQVVLVIALAREVGATRRAAIVAGALFVASPLVLQTSITYLAYGTSLALLLGVAWTSLVAVRTQRRLLAVAAGLLWGIGAFARPYDAVLALLALSAGIAWRHRDDLTRVARPAAWATLGAFGPLLLALAYNGVATGDPTQLPFNLLEPSDRLGFGSRRALPTDAPLDYTPARAIAALGRNLLLVVVWTAGGILTVGLAAATFVRRRLRDAPLLLALLVVWPLGYFFFWGSYLVAFVWDGALFLGPYYYLPMVAALVIPAGVGLLDLWDRSRVVGTLTATVVLVLGAAVAIPALVEQHDRTSQRTAVADALEASITEPALVFVPPLYGPYLQNPLSFLRNAPDLDGDVVYALDRGATVNASVRARHPDRAAYRLVIANRWSDQPDYEPEIRIELLGPGVPAGIHPPPVGVW